MEFIRTIYFVVSKLKSYLDVSIRTDFTGLDKALSVVIVFHDVQINICLHIISYTSGYCYLIYCLGHS